MRNPFSLPAQILSWFLALSFIIACWGNEPDVPSPGPTPPNPTQDTKAPVISIKIQEQNVIAGVKVDIKTDQILFDQTVAATWKDDISKSCKVEVGFVGEGGAVKAVKSGDRLEEPGKLQIKVTDEAGNDSSAEIKLTRVDSWAPEISVLIGEKNVVAGVKVKVEANQLLLDDQVAASWKDDYSESLTVDIQHIPENSSTGKAIESGETLFDAGKLQIAVQDDAKNKSTAEIKLTSVAITGLESLMGKELTVDVPVNLLEGLTIAEGLTLQKVEIEKDGVKSEIPNPEAYSPQIPGTIGIVLTLARTDGSTIEVKVDWISVKGIKYSKFSLTDLKPVDILPIIGQVESGDKNVYDHIEHLRVAEATRIRDMMWKYGAGNYSIKDYKELMGRLNIGIRGEIPLGYDNYEIICSIPATEPTSHASHQWSILNSLIQHANNKVLPEEYENSWQHNLMVFLEKHPNSINVFWCSSYTDAYNLSDYYGWMFKEDILDLSQKKNLIFFAYASNMLYMPYGSWQILIQ